MFGLGDFVKVRFDLTELKKDEVQEQLADLLDKICVFEGVGGAVIEAVDKAFIKSTLQKLFADEPPPTE